MVLLAKWILENDPESRVLIVTDRDELDKQIEGVMKNAGVIGAGSPSPRITSRAEFVTKPRLNNNRGTAILVAGSIYDARHYYRIFQNKPFEADMRHLLNSYVQADPAEDIGNLSSLSLTDLIVKTGINDAIARRLNKKGKLSKNAIAEGIINNVRKTIIRDQLTDPRFYEKMSKQHDDLIKQSRADAAAYEAWLKKAEELAKCLAQKDATSGVPAELHAKPEAIVIFNNLPDILARDSSVAREEGSVEIEKRSKLALQIDQAMREKAPAGQWLLPATHENKVGQLQPSGWKYSLEHGTCKEAKGFARICHSPRANPSARANPQRAIFGNPYQELSFLARSSGRAK